MMFKLFIYQQFETNFNIKFLQWRRKPTRRRRTWPSPRAGLSLRRRKWRNGLCKTSTRLRSPTRKVRSSATCCGAWSICRGSNGSTLARGWPTSEPCTTRSSKSQHRRRERKRTSSRTISTKAISSRREGRKLRNRRIHNNKFLCHEVELTRLYCVLT